MGSQHCCRTMAPANIRVCPPAPPASPQVLGVPSTQVLLSQSCCLTWWMYGFLLVGIHQIRMSGSHLSMTALISTLLQRSPRGSGLVSQLLSIQKRKPSSVLHPTMLCAACAERKDNFAQLLQGTLALQRCHQNSLSNNTTPKRGSWQLKCSSLCNFFCTLDI